MAASRVSKPTPAELISRGRQAATELERTQEAFDAVRRTLLEAIATTALDNVAGRERLYLSVCLLEPVRAMLIAAVTNGVAAEHEQHAAQIMGQAH